MTLRTNSRVLVIDAEPAVRQVLGSLLSDFYHVSLASSVEEAKQQLSHQQVDLVVLGADERQQHAMLQEVSALGPDLPVVVLVQREGQETVAGASGVFPRQGLASEAGRGAFLLIVDRNLSGHRRDREVLFRRRQTRRAARFGQNLFIGASKAAARVREEIKHAAPSNLNLLLTGETGVGKTLVAEAVHYHTDPQSERPLVVVEPATLTPALFESELFGHVRGAFTGAISTQAGAFEVADGGTLFLDEIGELPVQLQVKLLRAAETKVIRRIGDSRDIHLNVRVIAATNRNLETAITNGTFRQDLYQRLNEISLHIPPLRERAEDVIPLLEHFLGELSVQRRNPCRITAGAEKLLTEYRWPGNVRELRTLARRLNARGFPEEISEDTLVPLLPARLDRGPESDLPPDDRVRVFSRRVYLEELTKHGFSIRDTARALAMPYPTLRSRLKSLGMLDLLRTKRSRAPD